MLASIFDTDTLSPHGVCLLWRPELLWLHVVSDALTGLAYWSIPLVLLLIVLRRRDLIYTWAFELFALFILACGATHFLAIWTLWHPDYGLEGAVKAVTAALSVATAIAAWPLLPRILALPSQAELEAANAALSREIAERREAEGRARDSEARLAGVFEHLADGLFVVRAEAAGFVFETVNPAFRRMVARAREAAEGLTAADLLAAPDAAALDAACLACLATGESRSWESTVQSADGPRHWHSILVPLPATAEAPRRLLGSLRDVTELRRLQQDVIESARRATIGAMCAGVAHEMSQPVNIIGLWAGRAQARLEPGADRARRAMDIVLGQTRRLGELLDRIRDLARDTPGEAGVFDAAATAAATADVARRTWALERIELVLDAPDPAPIRGRPAQLEQVLLHLLENARDSVLAQRRTAPDAPARITLSVRPGAEADAVVITLADTGGGIPAELASRIFEPFVTTKEPGAGPGLGLPLAAGILRSLGGRLGWHNRADGAEFRITLPLATSAAPGPLA